MDYEQDEELAGDQETREAFDDAAIAQEIEERHAAMSNKLAFKVEHKGFVAEGFWGDGADGRVVVTRDGRPYKEFAYPAYKIFNIAAHWQDIVEGELINSDEGYRAAGWDGLGGYVMPTALPGERE